MEKQITKSTDWLTRGYSEEEIVKMKEEAIKEAEAELQKKQIEEMAEFIFYDTNCSEERAIRSAEVLYNAGYRKQVEGEWRKECLVDCEPYYLCSICEQLHDQPYDYCNGCGAKMKGGE